MGTDIVGLVEKLDHTLRNASSPERAEKEARYLKSALEHYGVGVPATRVAVKAALREAPDLNHDGLVTLVEALWEVPIHERRLAAVEALSFRTELLGLDDESLLEKLVREAGTWALIDPLAIGVIGDLVDHDKTWGEVLDRWATDDDFWIRRTALLALLVPLRRGDGDWDRFARYADSMLEETEFFIRKAIGWALRDTAKKRPELVFDWLLPRAKRASGVTVREALKPLTLRERQQIEAARM